MPSADLHLGVVGTEQQPGAAGSSSEWSRGESGGSGEEGGREGPGRCSVNLEEMSRRWVIEGVCVRVYVCVHSE